MKMAKKLRILAAAEIEGDSRLVKKLAEKAEKENVDLVILCGDLTTWVETKNIIKPFKDKNKRVLFVPGNHDSFITADVLAEVYTIRNLHGYSAVYNQVGFFGAGGVSDLPSFPGAISEAELFKTLKRAHATLKNVEKKVMVTHMHPEGSLSEFSGIKGSLAIKRAIKEFKPDLLLHGHIHEAEGAYEKVGNTTVINVGRSGTIIEI